MSMQADDRYKRTLKRVSNTTRSWRSVEDGCTTLLQCFPAIVAALQNLEHSDDCTTVTAARGLLVRLKDFEVILSVHVLRLVFQVTGPASRILQSTTADYAIATHLIRTCISKLEDMRSEQSSAWTDLWDCAGNFASENDISPHLPSARPRKTPRRAGEQAVDERAVDACQLFKTGVFYYCLDTVIVHLKGRFTDNILSVFEEICHFTHTGLMTEEDTLKESVQELCTVYDLDSGALVDELNEFRHAYRSVHHMIPVDDLTDVHPQCSRHPDKQQKDSDSDAGTDIKTGDRDTKSGEEHEDVSLTCLTML